MAPFSLLVRHKKTPRSAGRFGKKRLSGSQVLGHEFPVDQGPESFHVLRTQVAEIDVVGVLPQVDGQQRGGPGFCQRAAGVGGVDDGQGAVGLL